MRALASLFAVSLPFVMLASACGSPDQQSQPAPDTNPIEDAASDPIETSAPDTFVADTNTNKDTGTVSPDTNVDTYVPVDAGPASEACGGESGLQAGSPWPMPGRCPTRRGRTTIVGPHAAKLGWSTELGYASTGQPSIAADGTIYIPASGEVRALDPKDGTVKWKFAADALGVVIAADGTLYFGSWKQKLYALTPSGTLEWTYTAGKSPVTGEAFVTSPVIGADGTLYVGASDKKLHALKPDGTLKWSYENKFSYTNEISGGAPTLAPDGSIVYGTLGSADGWVVALWPDGKLKWSFHTGSSVISPPAIAADGTVYIGSQDKNLYAIASDGKKKWSFTTKERVYSGPSIANDGTIIFGGEDKMLYALRPDGTLRWSFPTDAPITNAVTIGGDGIIYLGPQKQTLYALNPDGTLLFQHVFPNFRGDHSAVAIGAKGQMYVTGVLSTQSAIVVFEP